MNRWVYVLIAASLFGTWPVLARFGQLSPGWLGFCFALGTGLISLLGIFLFNEPIPEFRAFATVSFAGTVNGLGMLAFAVLISMGPAGTKYMPVVFGLMPIFTVASAALFFKDSFSIQYLVGVVCISIGICVISWKPAM